MTQVNLANMVTLFRLLISPLVVWLILINAWPSAFFVFLIAGLSDALDGFIAKKYNLITRLGRFLDPIADKVLLASSCIALAVGDFLPLWFVILVVSRDFLIIGGALFLYTLEEDLHVQPILISKINTGLQIALIIFLLGAQMLSYAWETTTMVLMALTAITTLGSGAAYLAMAAGRLNRLEPGE